MMSYQEATCRATYEDPQVQEILQKIEIGDPDGHFDLVIFPPLWNDCIYGLIYKLNTTSIIISQLPIMPWVSSSIGTPWLPSITPLIYYEVPGEMNFIQRMTNFLARPNAADLLVLKAMIEAGDVTPQIGSRYPLKDTATAIRELGSGHGRGKVVITV